MPMSSFSVSASGTDTVLSPNLSTTTNSSLAGTTRRTEADNLLETGTL